MQQNRQPWAAISYPEMPAQVSPEKLARRSYVRIGVKASLITLPFILAAVFGAASQGSGPHYAGDRTAKAVMKLTKTTEIVFCEDVAKAGGSVSECVARPSAGPGDDEYFDVTFADAQGNFTVSWPGDHPLKGNVSN